MQKVEITRRKRRRLFQRLRKFKLRVAFERPEVETNKEAILVSIFGRSL
jgi:hypothetical protein